MPIYDSDKQLGKERNPNRSSLEKSHAVTGQLMAITKIEGVTPEEIRKIKNNLLEPIELDWDPKPVINLLDPKQFHEHYQELAPTQEEQEQCLEEINT
ncbi:hypothetical protein G9A89_022976 [Geosiphon pyriformis]|nr:hypothetical protein G9A89_022976 [Geosiphon pyriformis]